MHCSCIATRTITLELDAYEKLRMAKKPGESFSQVVRRASFADAPLTAKPSRLIFIQAKPGLMRVISTALRRPSAMTFGPIIHEPDSRFEVRHLGPSLKST